MSLFCSYIIGLCINCAYGVLFANAHAAHFDFSHRIQCRYADEIEVITSGFYQTQQSHCTEDNLLNRKAQHACPAD